MALSKNTKLVEQEGDIVSFPVEEATHIYQGALVAINAAGYLVIAGAGAGTQFAGVAIEECDNSAGADGALSCRVQCNPGRCYELTSSGLAQSNVGDKVYAVDDASVTLTEGTTSKQIVGHIVRYISATKALVRIAPFSGVGASA